MFVVANMITSIAEVINIILSFYMVVIIIRALISWVNPDPYNPIVQFLYKVTEPVLHPVRRLMPVYNIGIDLSPMIVIVVIIFLRSFLVNSLIQLAHRMQ
ncbi:MAG: YggT family protein [Nitrospirae bacterium]|nr:YggT family protein [Nitrospirota bacterium]